MGDGADERLTMETLAFALLPPSLPQPNQQNRWNSFVLQFFWNENGCCLCLKCEENLPVPAIYKKKGYSSLCPYSEDWPG